MQADWSDLIEWFEEALAFEHARTRAVGMEVAISLSRLFRKR